jgi:peptidyl-prolyl cis-trans isomerase A (cyclophilin A)
MPSRLTQAQIKDMADAERMLAQAETTTQNTPGEAAPAESAKPTETTATDKEQPKEDKYADMEANNQDLPAQAPDQFKVAFTCSNGQFLVEVHKDWAPLGVQRFYELVKSGYFDEARFFRVVPGFVVQFGMAADPAVGAKWFGSDIKDDPVKETNAPGTITFATSGPNSRTTQLFINLGNNARLDGMGFAPFGKVIEGMEVVKAITSQYGEKPDQGRIRQQGNAYLKADFPNLDYIERARVILEGGTEEGGGDDEGGGEDGE